MVQHKKDFYKKLYTNKKNYMKYFFKIFFFIAITGLIFSSCNKTADLPFYTNGKAAVLTSSETTLAPLSSDSDKVALTLNWTNPAYATDSATTKYVVQIDSTGRNFAKAISKTINGKFSAIYTNKELNTILLGYGLAFNKAYDLDMRVISSYANNNDKIVSNVVKVNFKTYITPPKVALPASGKLFIVGDATTFGWTNPDPMPAEREFTRLSETTWGGIFYLAGSGAYKLLQKPGEWSSQFHLVTGGTAAGGSFEQKDADPAFKSPAIAGWYKMVFDFQLGTFQVSKTDNPFTGAAPVNLYIVGDASPGGWSNPVPIPAQQFTKINSSLFELTIALEAGKSYLFLPLNGNWDHKFGGTQNGFGSILDDNNIPGSNTPAPELSGSYKITVNFATHTYSVVKQ